MRLLYPGFSYNTCSNLGPDTISLISEFLLYVDLLYPGYTVLSMWKNIIFLKLFLTFVQTDAL